MNIASRIQLNSGVEIPALGLGTWKTPPGKKSEDAAQWALEAGYRHIDTASVYGNEESIGRAIKKSRVPREDIFITTKLWNSDHNKAESAFAESLKKLKLDYVDLYLMHWPVEKVRNKTWERMEKILEGKKCRAIGVSNFTITHLDELLKTANVLPVVNQVEFSAYLYQKELLEFCRAKNIQVECYSPLTRGKRFSDAKLVNLSKKYGKSPAQILIRWALHHNLIVIPKSQRKERIIENANVFDFELSQGDINAMDHLNENFRVCWDPTNIP